jgi:hypothetical protein
VSGSGKILAIKHVYGRASYAMTVVSGLFYFFLEKHKKLGFEMLPEKTWLLLGEYMVKACHAK